MTKEECLECASRHCAPCGAPYAYLQAVYDDYAEERQGLHVTDLTKCPRQYALSKKVDVVADPSEYRSILLGTALHEFLEGYTLEAEAEYGISVFLEKHDTTLRGTIDLWDEKQGAIVDYKTTGNIYRDTVPKEEHVWQVNLYAWMLAKKNKHVKQAYISYITVSPSRKCKVCKRPLIPNMDGRYTCLCGNTGKTAPLFYTAIAPLYNPLVVEAYIDDRIRRINQEDPEPIGWRCIWCPFSQMCDASLADGGEDV